MAPLADVLLFTEQRVITSQTCADNRRIKAGEATEMHDVIRRLRGFRLIAIGVTALAVVSLSAGAMSLALFTDDVDVTNNAFTTGTVDLTASPASALFSVSAMMPGDTDYGQLTVSNSGTGELRYAMTTAATDPDSLALASALTLEIREKATIPRRVPRVAIAPWPRARVKTCASRSACRRARAMATRVPRPPRRSPFTLSRRPTTPSSVSQRG
jgi:predicted ribosomally synthesized peptide with SipW-like signal peptide